jgi:glycosyltransferase involved in cell wall biosynthesis
MIHLFINALAASAGGGLTYVRNVLPQFAARDDVRVTMLLSSALRAQLANFGQVSIIEQEPPGGVAARFWFEQRRLPQLIRQAGADVLLSTGNFALWNCPVPQILLSRNALYVSRDFQCDLRRRGDYKLWLDTELKAEFARWSIRQADVTVAPSRAFANQLRDWTGMQVTAIHHGFDAESFFADQTPLPETARRALEAPDTAVRLLFVSHYNYYRNFETLIRAVSLLRDRFAPRRVCLILTCKLCSEANPGSYSADSAAHLVKQLGLTECVIELGSIPYSLLHHLYRASNIYVTAAYAESFAHPLVEAMSSGLPIVAADTEVHREICGESALFFRPMSPIDLADQVCRFVQDEELARSSSERGQLRSRDFTWKQHVQQLLDLAQSRFAEAIAKPAREESVG